MHWAFHFNDSKKIDGIYVYYDRTPIIEAARKNFLAFNGSTEKQDEEMVVQIIKVKRSGPGLLSLYFQTLSRSIAEPDLLWSKNNTLLVRSTEKYWKNYRK